MESSTIIKLRQAESANVEANGSYSISLKESVTLEKGDICKIHTAIIDTTSESVVEIVEPTRINMGIGKYFRNWKPADTGTSPAFYNYTATPSTPMPDLITPIHFCATRSTTDTDDYNITQIGVQCVAAVPVGHFGDCELQFQYIEVGTEILKVMTVVVPRLKVIDHFRKPVMIDVDHLVRTKKFTLLSSNKFMRKHKISNQFDDRSVPGVDRYTPKSTDISSLVVYGSNGGPIAAGKGILNVFEEILSFDLDSGTYTPQELTTIINDKISYLKSGGPVGNVVTEKPGAYPVNSPVLRTIYDIHDLIETLPGAPSLEWVPESNVDRPTPTYYLHPVIENTTLADRTTAKNLLMGANEVSINFDDSLQKLNFDILHFPIYGGPSTELQPSIAYTGGNDSDGNPLPVEPQTSNGGIFFTRLESLTLIRQPDGSFKEGLNTDFWSQLGFNGAIVNVSHDTLTPIDPGADEVIPVQIRFTPGENITSVFLSLDGIVNKSNVLLQLVPDVSGAVTTLTTPIISNREFNNVINDEGFYLLEIGMNLPQKMIGGATGDNTTSNKVQSIIGKYYSQDGNFLQDGGEGSIVYQHMSDVPQLLSELNVRILHADQTLPEPTEIGPKNCIFLEIVKTSQN